MSGMTKYLKSFLRHYTYAHPNELVKPGEHDDEIHLIIMLAGG
mgnify:CR=1 FL=1